MSQPAARPVARPPSSRRGRQTVLDMVRSMVVVLVAVLAVVLLVPRPQEAVRQPVDVPGAAQAASVSADFPVVVPRVPRGWTPNGARFGQRSEDDVPTWHVGYVTPSERYAGLEVARAATPRWLEDVTAGGEEDGSRQVAGATWRQLLSADGRRRSLVLERDGLTTVVTGTATPDELATLAEASRG